MNTKYIGLPVLIASGGLATHAALLHSFPVAQSEFVSHSVGASRGCRTGGIGGIHVTEPSWVSVEASDRPQILEGTVTSSEVTFEDWPFAHDSHDMDSYIVPDERFQKLQSNANEVFSGKRNIGVEWETKYFPIQFWPAAGDRAWVMGRWIFDCGHPPYHTEIHPPVATAFTRLDPTILPGDSSPSYTHKTLVYISGNGGYYVQKAGGRDYVFNVPLPPKPSPNAEPTFHVIGRPKAGMPQPILEIKRLRDGQQALEVRCPLSGVPDPTPARWDLYEWVKAARKERTLLKPKWPPLNRPNCPVVYSTIIASGWREKANPAKSYRRLRVTFKDVQIHTDHDPLGQAEWHLFLRANGQWIQAFKAKKVRRGVGFVVGQSVEVLVPEDGALSIQAQGWEADNDRFFRVGPPPDILDSGAKDENEKLGKCEQSFKSSANFGIGAQSKRSSAGDYTVNYTIAELAKFPP